MDIDEIEEICYYNLSYGIPIKDTLTSLGFSELIDEFTFCVLDK
tara:strand:- start:3117 stop:3248 length:132 start_codon:yes stop_codon:yes gene_type:complete